MGGYRRLHLHGRPDFLHGQDDLPCQQLQGRMGRALLVGAAGRHAIDRVAADRPAHGGGMDAQLVGAAGEGAELQPGDRGAVRINAASGDPPAGLRGQAQGVDLHPPSPAGIEAAERQVDEAFGLVGSALDDGPIGLVDPAVLEQAAQIFEGLAVAAQHQAARCVTVESMGEGRGARQAKTQGLEIHFKVLAPLGAPVDGNASRFVHDEHEAVAVE